MTYQAATLPKSAQKLRRILPLFNRILVKRADPLKESKGGIVLPENPKSRISRGTVIAVGPGTRTENGKQIPVCLKPGDEVILPDYGGTRVEMEDEVYFVFREPDILAKIKE
ncbi:10 kDa heat shock protein, mitochondrial-like [Cylas formicarius]|uniref:10 kDa heat shock protein, mitochondrial-like n=1 Tax=Cylas formicarius TaxID=197179 RepID=UPI002958AFB0|nr:10 kDa heat shock protein, mitochondrial-like [Cylas formicarius]